LAQQVAPRRVAVPRVRHGNRRRDYSLTSAPVRTGALVGARQNGNFQKNLYTLNYRQLWKFQVREQAGFSHFLRWLGQW
jgi:hypothetical protein